MSYRTVPSGFRARSRSPEGGGRRTRAERATARRRRVPRVLVTALSAVAVLLSVPTPGHATPTGGSFRQQVLFKTSQDPGYACFRIPAVVVSPFAKRGAVSHQLCGFESIISLMTYRWNLGHLTTRDARAQNIGQTMAWTAPNFERPNLPGPQQIASAPCTLGGGDITDNQQKHAGDLAALEDLAERFRIPTGTGNLDQIFRQPDSLQKALT